MALARIVLLALIGLSIAASANTNQSPFAPSSSVEQNLYQHKRLPHPTEEVWWIATGKDMAWNNKNLTALFPSVPVYRDGPVRALPYNLNPKIDEFEIDAAGKKMSFGDFLASDHSTNMGIVILHKGQIVFENYSRMEEYEKPIWWSVTKVFASSLVAILEDRGQVDTTKPVEFYLPELSKSEFAGITVRNVLDMASGVDCSDGNYARGTCYYEFEASLSDAVRSDKTADNPYEAIATMRPGKWSEQGKAFDYSGVNTFILSWIVEKVMAMPFQDAVTKEFWLKLGAEGDASFFAARYGIALSSGGFMSKVRDMARFGLLFTPSYKVVSEEQLISDRYLQTIIHGGRPELIHNARFPEDGIADIKHNVYQWDLVYQNNDIYKGGWAGQGLLINPERDLVAVYVGYAKDDQFSGLPVLPRLRAVLNSLYPMHQD